MSTKNKVILSKVIIWKVIISKAISRVIINIVIVSRIQLTGQNLGQVFNFRSDHLHAADLW